MPVKTDFSRKNCSLARALGAVGDPWSLLILRDAFIGASRFGEFQASLGIARNMLAIRLAQLTAEGILARSGPPRRPRYRLTGKGEALLPALLALLQWGDAYASQSRPPILVADSAGRPAQPIEARTAAGRLSAQTVRFLAGPGANAHTRSWLRRRSGEATPV